MKTVCVSLSLLSAVSFGSLLKVTGRVGQDVEFKCSDWETLINVDDNEKYFCHSPCTEDGHKLLQSPHGETRHRGQLSITNSGEELLVRIAKLKIEDAGKYYCGVDIKLLKDELIEVNLQVEGEKSNPALTTRPTTIHSSSSSLSPSLDNKISPTDPSVSSDGVSGFSDVTRSVTNTRLTTVEQEQGPSGSVTVISLLVSALVVTAAVTLLLLLLWLLKRRTAKKKQEKQRVGQEQVVHYEEIRPKDQNTAGGPADLDHSLYANSAELGPLGPTTTTESSSGAAPEGRTTTTSQDDLQYSTLHFDKLRNNPEYSSVQRAKNTVYSEVQLTESSSRNETVYSLAQIPPGN